MKIIRWWGIGIFVILLVLITLGYYLLAPKLIANAVEDFGSEAWGAKVEVESVDLALFPLSVTLNQIVATDREQPMQNIFDAKEIKFSVDSEALLWKKIVVDEMVIDGVKTATPRATSGELVGGRKTTQAVQEAFDFSIPEVSQKDIEKVVSDADLITLKRVDTLKASQQKIEAEWQQALDKQAFDKRTQEIRSEYDRLSKRLKDNKLNLIKDRKDWKKLKQRIDAERKLISSLSDKLKQDRQIISQQLNDVKKGPKDDVKALLDRFGLGAGVEGLVDKYLGPQYTPWVMRALDMAKSMKTNDGNEEQAADKVAVKMGNRVYFSDSQTFPDILVKKVKLGGSDNGWILDGNGFDLGYFPWVTGQPAKLNLQLEGNGKAKVNLSSLWPDKNTMVSKINTNIEKWQLTEMQFMQSKEGQWLINSGSLSAKINGELTLENIDLRASFQIESPKLSVPEGLSDWQQSLAKSVNQQNKIDFKLVAKGSLSEPKIKLSSSLEKLFSKAIGDKVKQKAKELTADIEESVSNKVGDLSELENFNERLAEWKSQLGDKDKLMKNLLGKIKI